MSSVAERRQKILDQIAKAASLAQRDPADVSLIAVTKGRPTDDIEPLIDAGQRDFGESRVQEALAKWPPLLARHPDIRLHAIGRLQSNKAAEAVQLFGTIHSLDRSSLLNALTGGVRYNIERDNLSALQDQRRDSQAVYVGTAFKF